MGVNIADPGVGLSEAYYRDNYGEYETISIDITISS